MTDIKVIIAGGREFNDYKFAEYEIIRLLLQLSYDNIEIVSGGARGADNVGEKFAAKYNLPIKKFIPDWDGLGKRAGFVRNSEMANYSTHLIAFWDGKSSGTRHMIKDATDKGLMVAVVYY